MIWDIHWVVLPAHTANPHTLQFLFWGTKQNRPFLILNSCIFYGKQGNGTQSTTYCVLSSSLSAFFHKRHLLSSLHFKDGFLKVTQLFCSGDGVWTHLSRDLNLLPPLLPGSPSASWAKGLFCRWTADPTTWKGGADHGGHSSKFVLPPHWEQPKPEHRIKARGYGDQSRPVKQLHRAKGVRAGEWRPAWRRPGACTVQISTHSQPSYKWEISRERKEVPVISLLTECAPWEVIHPAGEEFAAGFKD